MDESKIAKIGHATALEFILAGNAYFTVRSVKTGVRYTFRVSKAKKNETMWFVSLLTGPDNISDYSYMGVLSGNKFRVTKASKVTADSVPVKAFSWVLSGLVAENLVGVELWHAGRCGRCGRSLTVPESVEAGYGPECIGLVGGVLAKTKSLEQAELPFMPSVRTEASL